MNVLTIGADPTPLLNYVPDRFLFIDDGPLIDQLTPPGHRRTVFFDPKRHRFNPLKDMDYRRAQEFLHVLDATFPEGENTLTKGNSNHILLKALLAEPKRLSQLTHDSKDPYERDAHRKIERILLSPVLEPVLNRASNMSFKGSIIARLDRAELGDFDAFVLGNLLMSLFDGPVIVPDFGFYASPFHVRLIRQNRLIAGIRAFDEVPKLKNHLLQIEEKIGVRCTPDDARLLALYDRMPFGTIGYGDYIAERIS